MAEFLSATGPIFGPDFVLVTVNDETGTQYQLEVYPDASNEDLRKAVCDCLFGAEKEFEYTSQTTAAAAPAATE